MNNCLYNFWFSLSILSLITLVVFFVDSSGVMVVFAKNLNFGNIAVFLERSLFLFLIPLLIISLALASYVWLKIKEKSYQGLFASIVALVSFALVFLLISQFSILQTKIDSGNSIIFFPSIGVAENLENNKFDDCPESIFFLNFKYPKNWTSCEVVDNKIYFSAEYEDINFDLVSEIKEISEDDATLLFNDNNVKSKEVSFQLSEAMIYEIVCDDGIICNGLTINNENAYLITWRVNEGSQALLLNNKIARESLKEDVWKVMRLVE